MPLFKIFPFIQSFFHLYNIMIKSFNTEFAQVFKDYVFFPTLLAADGKGRGIEWKHYDGQ